MNKDNIKLKLINESFSRILNNIAIFIYIVAQSYFCQCNIIFAYNTALIFTNSFSKIVRNLCAEMLFVTFIILNYVIRKMEQRGNFCDKCELILYRPVVDLNLLRNSYAASPRIKTSLKLGSV